MRSHPPLAGRGFDLIPLLAVAPSAISGKAPVPTPVAASQHERSNTRGGAVKSSLGLVPDGTRTFALRAAGSDR